MLPSSSVAGNINLVSTAKKFVTQMADFWTFPSCIVVVLQTVLHLKEWLTCSWTLPVLDNAYLGTPYMATPYSGGSIGTSKDMYNFFRSQFCIKIKCAFGKLTQHGGILRSALPQKMTIKKSVALVMSLARLHNFCTNKQQSIEISTGQDTLNLEQESAVPLKANGHTDVLLSRQLLGGGEHFECIDRNGRRRLQRSFIGIQLPQDCIHASVMDQDLQRPPHRKRI